MSEPTDDFEYERRFFCRELPAEYDDGDAPTLIIQSYYVHADNYALRVRLVSRKVHVDMTPDVNPVAVLDEYRDRFSEAYVTVKGPSVGGTRYEVEREIDTRIAAELIKRGGSLEELVDKSESLSYQSKAFMKQSKDMNSCCTLL